MKVYVDTWIYVTEKFGNMGFIEVYRGILRYETGIYPTIPNFIFNQISFICNGFWVLGNALRTNSAPIFQTAPFLRCGLVALKLTDCACHRIIGDVDISIHSSFDAFVAG